MVAVADDLEAPFSLDTNAVQLRELLHPLLAHTDAACQQFPTDAWPIVGATNFGVDGLDVHKQHVVAQMAAMGDPCPLIKVLVVLGHTNAKHPALHLDRPQTAVASVEGVLQVDPFARYAVALPRMSRSIFARANSARSRLISICSPLTGALLSAPLSLPWPWALNQLNSVWSTTPNVREALAALHQPHFLLFEFERVPRSRRFCHFRSPCLNLNTQLNIRFSGAKSYIVVYDLLTPVQS